MYAMVAINENVQKILYLGTAKVFPAKMYKIAIYLNRKNFFRKHTFFL